MSLKTKKKKAKKISRTGYMCAVDFRWELGEVMDSTPIYSSVKALKEQRKCWVQCGIIKVKVTGEKMVSPEDFGRK